MKDIQREDIYIISPHSNLGQEGIDRCLKENVYNKKEDWQTFFKLFFITLGAGFTVAGIIFFFAYNWADLHKFIKIGLIEGLIIITTGFVLLPKINNNLRNIILTGAAAIVGILFAVFGQIYQTGANAYDFFLAWTVFVSLWVFVSNFPPLWLLYLVLINTTFSLYAHQVAGDWPRVLVLTGHFIINASVLIMSILLSKNNKRHIPVGFRNILALAAVTAATFGMIHIIFETFELSYFLLPSMVIVLYPLGIRYGLKTKSVFYLSIIFFSLIVITSSWLVNISEDEIMILFISLFIIGSVTLLIKNLIGLQKKWANEK